MLNKISQLKIGVEQKNNCIEQFCKYIKDEKLKQKTRDILLQDQHDMFFKIPASKRGSFHPEISNKIPFGLINHTLRVMYILDQMCIEENIRDIERDECMVAAIFHDIGKIQYWDPSVACNDCGTNSVKMLKGQFNDDIMNMIFHHMHHWEDKSPESIREILLAHADFIASRKEFEIRNLVYIE